MAYEKLLKNKRTIKETPIVTFGVQEVLYLNCFIMRNYFKGVNWVELLYDKEKSSLAIKPCVKEEVGAFRLNFSSPKNRSTGVVSARSAIKSLKIDYSKTKQFPANWNPRERMLEIKLGG